MGTLGTDIILLQRVDKKIYKRKKVYREPALYLFHLFQSLDFPVSSGIGRRNGCGQIEFGKFTFDLFQNFRIFRIRVHGILIFVFFQGVQIPVPMGGFGLCGFQFIDLGFLIGIGI